MFLKLKNSVHLVHGDNGYLLLDLKSNRLFNVEEHESKILKEILSGCSFDEIIRRGVNEAKFVETLLKNDIVTLVDQIYYEESWRKGQLVVNNIRSVLSLDTLVIQFPLECGKGCKYCGNNLLFGCFLCENHINMFDPEKYVRLVIELKKYYTIRNLIITGGDIFKHYELVSPVLSIIPTLKNVNFSIFNSLDNISPPIIKELKNSRMNLIALLDCTNGKLEQSFDLYKEIALSLQPISSSMKFCLVTDNFTIKDIQYGALGVSADQVQYSYVVDTVEELRTNDFYKRGMKITVAQQLFLRKKLHPCLVGMLAIDKDFNVLPCLKMKKCVLSKINLTNVNLFENRDVIEKYWMLPVKKSTICSGCKYNVICMDCRATEEKFAQEEKVCVR